MDSDPTDSSSLQTSARPLSGICESLFEAAVRYWVTGTTAPNSSAVLWKSETPIERPAMLTVGLPWCSTEENLKRMGRRLVWWPQGIPPFRRIGIASSRLSRHLDQHTRWFDLLRTVMLRLDPAEECLCVVTGTAAARAAERAALLLQRPVLDLRVEESTAPVDSEEIQRWISDRSWEIPREQMDPGGDEAQMRSMVRWSAVVSPEVKLAEVKWPESSRPQHGATESARSHVQDDALGIQSVPYRDRLQFAVSSRLYILRCHAGGNMERLMLHHLNQSAAWCDGEQEQSAGDSFSWEPVMHLVSEWLTPRIRELNQTSRTLVPWFVAENPMTQNPRVASEKNTTVNTEGELHSSQTSADSNVVTSDAGVSGAGVPRPVSTPWTSPDDWLLHWTRSCPGAWPGQDGDDWLDELILGCASADHSAFAALLRIVGDQCLKASSLGIRGGYSVISFTEVPLHEFRERRVYRRHRQRYDFEPWGLGIRRSVLVARGAGPVCYGDDDAWQQLPEHLRPWFQKATAGDGPTNNVQEREWRIVGDLLLDTIPADDICLFVDTEQAAESLALLTSSPVLVVPQGFPAGGHAERAGR